MICSSAGERGYQGEGDDRRVRLGLFHRDRSLSSRRPGEPGLSDTSAKPSIKARETSLVVARPHASRKAAAGWSNSPTSGGVRKDTEACLRCTRRPVSRFAREMRDTRAVLLARFRYVGDALQSCVSAAIPSGSPAQTPAATALPVTASWMYSSATPVHPASRPRIGRVKSGRGSRSRPVLDREILDEFGLRNARDRDALGPRGRPPTNATISCSVAACSVGSGIRIGPATSIELTRTLDGDVARRQPNE